MATTKKAETKTDTRFDVRAEAYRVFYAGVGVNDLAVEMVRDAVSDVQKSVKELDLDPKALRERVATLVNERLDALTKDARTRREAVESRIAELQKELKGYPDKVEHLIDENVEAMNGRYEDLIKRGESLVERIRNQEATRTAVADVKTAVSKVKTTRTQAEHAAKAEIDEVRTEVKKDVEAVRTATKSAAKKASANRKASAKKATPAKKATKAAESSAKATATSTKKAATSIGDAVADAAEKVGD